MKKRVYHVYALVDDKTVAYYIGCFTNLKRVTKAITRNRHRLNTQFKIVIKDA
jgi:hypothetical protein